MKLPAILLVVALAANAQGADTSVRHVVVAREEGKFLGWPANHGPMRAWGDEFLVAFTAAEFAVRSATNHAYDPSKPQHVWLARSRDGGVTWAIEKPEPLRGHKDIAASPVQPASGGIQSSNPDCVVVCGYEDEDRGRSWFQVSKDRGRSWGPRQALPDFGLASVNGRTDYLLSGVDDALFLFNTQSAHKQKEGRVFAARTRNGGKTWTREGWVGPDPAAGFSIQPATVRLDPRRLVCATRRQEPGRSGIDVNVSHDDGRTWRTLVEAADTGQRSTAVDLIRLRDGRLALAYAQRDRGSICVKLSNDDGQTWSEEVVLRSGAGNWDIGYPRLAQRQDGQLVTAYYWNDDPQRERYIAATVWTPPAIARSDSASAQRHLVVFGQTNLFAGWPANNGVWSWDGREILVGFVTGRYRQQSGHNIEPPYRSVFARSLNGGESWQHEDPDRFVGDPVKQSNRPPENADFTRDGFMFRGVGNGYHGSEAPRGAFFCSWDRGRSWQGPFDFGALADDPALRGMEFTPRTDYFVEGPKALLVLLSARAKPGNDKVFCARTMDGGATFQFVSWVVPPTDPHRAVMPSTVRLTDTHLVTAVRRRMLDVEQNWVDAYASEDRGKTWSVLSKAGETGDQNGNPPALLGLKDGRLCCFYGNRVRRQLLARRSADHGRTWDGETVLRDDYASPENDADLGYPRAVQRADGQVLVFYYWASKQHPQQHIAATIWTP